MYQRNGDGRPAWRERFARILRERRGSVILLAVFLLSVTITAVWLLKHLVPQHDHFLERRGTLVRTELGELEKAEGFVGQAVQLEANNGLKVNLRVLRAAGAEERLPLVLLLGGHRTGRDAVDVLGHPGGIAVAALDYPYHGPERPRGVQQVVRSFPAMQRGVLDTPPAVSLALDWLIAQPWVDPERVELMGVSLGVPFAAVAGANDERFRRVWLIHGANDNREWMANRLESRIENKLMRHAAARLVHLLAYGASFDTGAWVAKISPRRVVIIGARDDEQMPRASVEQLYAAAREPKRLEWSEGGHVRTSRTDIVRQLLAMVRSGMETD